MRRLISVLVAAIAGIALLGAQPSVSWKAAIRSDGADGYELVLSGRLAPGLHTYGVGHPYSAPTLEIQPADAAVGALYNISAPVVSGGEEIFESDFQLGQKIRPGVSEISGEITWQACNAERCFLPEHFSFSAAVSGQDSAQNEGKNTINKNVIDNNNIVSRAENQGNNSSIIETPEESGDSGTEGGKKGIWALIIEAILWGFAMLLTPCVFPMVPMTVSYFVKGGDSPATGRFKAFMYGLFIILLYTVPISVIIGLTRLLGGETVTADIFNWLATHWLPNLLFFAIFMVFAASFFGAFEITLPSSIVNKSDKESGRGGLAGVFFMALTLVLVSFSCTGPIVGSVLIKSTQGEFWTPMVTMLAFSTAFALPFTLLALFPSVLKKMRSGSWLGSVKIVLGFVELALGLKFLSVADQTYHWGILDREIYLAIWIVVFSLLGFYLLGKIRFKGEEKVEQIGLTRLTLAIAVFSFVVYLIPGMWGAPLKALSGYLPPIQTQDFVLGSETSASQPASQVGYGKEYGLHTPLGLPGYFTLEEGFEVSAQTGKPVFLDISGHGCVNCREMESRVWSDPRVSSRLRDEFVVVTLYTDDKTKLKEKDWVTTSNGKVLKEIGRANSYIVTSRFGVNAQPTYIILDANGNIIAGPRGYNLDIEDFLAFLDEGK